jgi:hypothetical protein
MVTWFLSFFESSGTFPRFNYKKIRRFTCIDVRRRNFVSFTEFNSSIGLRGTKSSYQMVILVSEKYRGDITIKDGLQKRISLFMSNNMFHNVIGISIC